MVKRQKKSKIVEIASRLPRLYLSLRVLPFGQDMAIQKLVIARESARILVVATTPSLRANALAFAWQSKMKPKFFSNPRPIVIASERSERGNP
ncbi:hypothetical protein [Helicobacter sp. MIT 01-3238]|uniref:hypothetical protein n=1 Tax=Helicobacter sp. MIT 01-3238 TaxID=398627 RepID=UPI0011C02C5B|nr:hypothetical protein [Helicobacter sp. MIT 01-3238]